MPARTPILHTFTPTWRLRPAALLLLLGLTGALLKSTANGWGPLWDESPLTFGPGTRTEAVGPLWALESGEGSMLWRIPPLIAHSTDVDTERSEYDVLYPLFTWDRFGTEYRAQLFQLISFSGGNTVEDQSKKRTTLFPFYFRQTSSDPTNNYFALLPIYGHVRNRLLRDEVRFALAPLWIQSKRRGMVTDNFVAPFFHVRHGERLRGWQFWPLVGMESKGLTWRTNSLDEPEPVGGHRHFFALWPFYLNNKDGLETPRAVTNQAIIPLYSLQRSAARDNTTLLWPFFTHTVNREQQFVEWGVPFPFIGWARGPGKNANRLWPLYGNATNATTRQNFLLWPLYTHKRIVSGPLDRERTRFGFFAYSDLRQSNTLAGTEFRRRDLWPLGTHQHEQDGRERLQVLAPLEPFFPNNKGFRRLWSPLWSIYRSERDPKRGCASQSLLWNVWRRDVSPTGSRTSALFGMVRTENTAQGRRWRLLGIGLHRRPADVPDRRGPDRNVNNRGLTP